MKIVGWVDKKARVDMIQSRKDIGPSINCERYKDSMGIINISRW